MKKNPRQPKNKLNFTLPALRAGYRVLLYLCAVFFIGLSLYLVFTSKTQGPATITCYVLGAAGIFIGGAYLFQDLKKIFLRIWKRLRVLPVIQRLADDYRLRSFVLMIPGLLVNIVYALLNAITGVTAHSAWFGSFAAYYLLLSIARAYAIWEERKLRGANIDHAYRNKREAELYHRFSVWFLFFGIILGGLTVLLHESEGSKSYPGFTIYAMAAYAFFRVFISIRALVVTRKENSLLLMTIRKIGYMDACLAILVLQVAMLGAFGQTTDETTVANMNTMTGAVLSIMVFGMGVYGIVKYRKMKQ